MKDKNKRKYNSSCYTCPSCKEKIFVKYLCPKKCMYCGENMKKKEARVEICL